MFVTKRRPASVLFALFSLIIAVSWFSSAYAVEGVGLFWYREDDKPPDNGVYKTDFATGKSTLLYKPSNSNHYINGIDISPDARQLAFALNGKMYVMNNDGSDVKVLLTDYNGGRFGWTSNGILWAFGAKIYRHILSTGKTTMVADFSAKLSDVHSGHIKQATSANNIYCSGDGTHIYARFSLMHPDPCNDNCHQLHHNVKPHIQFSSDFSKYTYRAQQLWGHGDGIAIDGGYVMHVSWGHSEIWAVKFMEFGTVPVVTHGYTNYVDKIIKPTVISGRWDQLRLIGQCYNNADYFCMFGDTKNDYAAYYVMNRETEKFTVVPNPLGKENVRSVRGGQWPMFFGCWLGGDLPSPFGTSPYIQLDKTELVFNAVGATEPQVQTITVGNIGKGTLGKVSTGISPDNAGWLSAAVEGNGGNEQKITVTVDPSKLPADENAAEISISGGSATNSVTCKVIANTGAVLSAPTQLAAEPSGDSLLDAALSWKDNSADETGFAIERRSESGAWEKIADVGANAVSYTDKRLDYGAYYYRVKAIAQGKESSASDSAKVTIIGIYWIRVITPPQGAVYKPGMNVAVSWTCNRVDQVFIQYSLDEGLSWTTITQEGGIRKGDANWQNYQWTISDIEAEKVLVKVSEYDKHAHGVSGAFAISKTAASISSILHAPKLSEHISVYAAQGRLCINAVSADPVIVRIYDSFGRLVLERNVVARGESFSSQPLPSGIYTAVVQSRRLKKSERIAIHK